MFCQLILNPRLISFYGKQTASEMLIAPWISKLLGLSLAALGLPVSGLAAAGLVWRSALVCFRSPYNGFEHSNLYCGLGWMDGLDHLCMLVFALRC